MVEYSPFSEVAMKNPHETYRQLRREAPVYYLEEFDAWALSTFEDIWTASMDRKHFTSTKGATGDQLISKTFPVVPMLFVMDPPRSHNRSVGPAALLRARLHEKDGAPGSNSHRRPDGQTR